MKVARHAWTSPSTGYEMRLLHYGERGTPIVYLPSSGGDEAEFERYGMDRDCTPWIGRGLIQVVSVDGGGPRGLWNDSIAPAERIRAYAATERYVVDELLPWIAELAGPGLPILVGASYGAFLAANVLLKRPATVESICGLGGVYGLWHRLDGYHDDEVYFHTPLEYLPRLEDTEILGAIRRTGGATLYAAGNDGWLDSSRRLATVLHEKRLPHTLQVWPAPADHHEQWWKRQLRCFLEDRFSGRPGASPPP